MLEELMQLVQQHGQQAVVNNTEVPNEHNEGIMQEAGNSIMGMVQNMISSGQGAQIATAAQDPNHPEVQQMQSGFMSNIMEKFGVSEATAQNLATTLLPKVLGAFANKPNITGQQENSVSSFINKLGF